MRDPRQVGADYDAGADGYDARHAEDAATRRRTAVLDAILLDAIAGAARVLDLGCGTGRLLARVRAPSRLGVDVAARMLAVARGRGLEVARADAHALPLADRSVDAIVAGKGVVRYLDPDRALAECARVLAPGGVLALHNYGNRTLTWRGRTQPIPELWEWGSLGDLAGPARRAGLQITRARCFRPVRIYPYFIEIPAWIAARAPVQLWSHCVAVLNTRGPGID